MNMTHKWLVCIVRIQVARRHKDKQRDHHFVAGTSMHTSKELPSQYAKSNRGHQMQCLLGCLLVAEQAYRMRSQPNTPSPKM